MPGMFEEQQGERTAGLQGVKGVMIGDKLTKVLVMWVLISCRNTLGFHSSETGATAKLEAGTDML